MKLERGLVQVYTGNGKGKTTAALGLGLRAAGHGLKVHMIQFMKGGGPYGEHTAAERLAPWLRISPTGQAGWVKKGAPDPEDRREAERALELARQALAENYDLVILDEANGAVDFGLVSVEELLALIAMKPAAVELVLTGRNAHERILEAADLVSEMREVKHYYRQGIGFRAGIER
jgi:cob(I)alamin adenosyltransferase